MKLYNLGTKRSFVNLFADFILNELDPLNKLSIIQVTDCFNFLVIGGKTESKNILDLSDIKNKFNDKYGNNFNFIDIVKLNIIDLIVYDVSVDVPKNITFGNFYNSERPIYYSSQMKLPEKSYSYNEYDGDNVLYSCEFIDSENFDNNIKQEPIHISSEFPHGYSFENLRTKFYYSEYISLNLFSIMGISKIKLTWVGDSVNLTSDSFIDSDYIDSMMKDVFNFDSVEFTKKIKEYQILNDILLPFESKPWLIKDKISELFIT